MAHRPIQMSEEQLRSVVRETVAETLRDIGIMAADEDAISARRRDFQFLTDLRKSSESAKAKVGTALLLAAFSAFVAMTASGFKLWMTGKL